MIEEYIPRGFVEFRDEVERALVFFEDSTDGITIACYRREYIPIIRITIRILLHAEPDRVLRDMVVYNRKPIRIIAVEDKIEDGCIHIEGYKEPIYFVGLNIIDDVIELEKARVLGGCINVK